MEGLVLLALRDRGVVLRGGSIFQIQYLDDNVLDDEPVVAAVEADARAKVAVFAAEHDSPGFADDAVEVALIPHAELLEAHDRHDRMGLGHGVPERLNAMIAYWKVVAPA